MKKSILIVGIFALLAAVALMYAIQYLDHGSIPLTIKHFPSNNVNPPDPVISNNPDSNVQFEWKLGNPYLMKNSDGTVFLDLRVTGKTLPDVDRKRMNLVLVIDRSGSMGSENKLEQVKEAASAIVNGMNATDRLAVVIYDDTIQTIVPSSPVENKERIREAIFSLSPGGSTNLCGGLQQGFEEVRRHFKQDYVNRIILLSDGLANVGIIDPEQIASEAKRIRENSISVSAMGVGIDYNENLMANIADYSGGNYYYISRDVNMAEIFKREWNLMQSVVATNAKTTLQLGDGVDIVDVAGFKWEKRGNKLTIQVPDVYSGETKRILVQLQAPANTVKIVDLGTGEFICTDITGKTPEAFSLNFHPSIQVVEDQSLVKNNSDRDVQIKANSFLASKKMEEAYRYLEAGEVDRSKVVAQEAQQQLNSLGYGYAETAPQASRYDSFLKTLNSPAPLDEEAKKDLLKKQKEEERKTSQQ